jgi:hypothetical protein
VPPVNAPDSKDAQTRRGTKDTQQSAKSITRAVAHQRPLHRPLVVLAAVTAVLAVGLLPTMVVDHRQLLGVSVWLKPWKFAVSITIYSLTVAWMVTLVDRGARLARRAATVAAVALGLEIALITAQAARGVSSHFNTQTPPDSMVFYVMGASIGAVCGRAVDQVGRVLGTGAFPVDAVRYQAALAWMNAHGELATARVEGTGSYGTGRARYLAACGVKAAGVIRPNRQARRQRGQSDTADAVAALAARRRRLLGTAPGRCLARPGVRQFCR